MAGISIWQLAIIALIIVLLFGTKKLRGLGGDLGSAVKGFKKAVTDEDKESSDTESTKDEALANKSNAEESETVKEKDRA